MLSRKFFQILRKDRRGGSTVANDFNGEKVVPRLAEETVQSGDLAGRAAEEDGASAEQLGLGFTEGLAQVALDIFAAAHLREFGLGFGLGVDGDERGFFPHAAKDHAAGLQHGAGKLGEDAAGGAGQAQCLIARAGGEAGGGGVGHTGTKNGAGTFAGVAGHAFAGVDGGAQKPFAVGRHGDGIAGAGGFAGGATGAVGDGRKRRNAHRGGSGLCAETGDPWLETRPQEGAFVAVQDEPPREGKERNFRDKPRHDKAPEGGPHEEAWQKPDAKTQRGEKRKRQEDAEEPVARGHPHQFPREPHAPPRAKHHREDHGVTDGVKAPPQAHKQPRDGKREDERGAQHRLIARDAPIGVHREHVPHRRFVHQNHRQHAMAKPRGTGRRILEPQPQHLVDLKGERQGENEREQRPNLARTVGESAHPGIIARATGVGDGGGKRPNHAPRQGVAVAGQGGAHRHRGIHRRTKAAVRQNRQPLPAQHRPEAPKKLPSRIMAQRLRAFPVPKVGPPKAAFGKDLHGAQANDALRHHREQARPQRILRQPHPGMRHHVIKEDHVERGGNERVDRELGNVLLGRVHCREGHVHHAHEAGDANEAEDPHARLHPVRRDGEPRVAQGVFPDGIAHRHQRQRQRRVDEHRGVEPLPAHLQPFPLRPGHLGLPHGKGVEAPDRPGQQPVEERDEGGQPPHHAHQAIVHLAQRHQRPAPGEKPTGQREKRPPVRRGDVQCYAPILGHFVSPHASRQYPRFFNKRFKLGGGQAIRLMRQNTFLLVQVVFAFVRFAFPRTI